MGAFPLFPDYIQRGEAEFFGEARDNSNALFRADEEYSFEEESHPPAPIFLSLQNKNILCWAQDGLRPKAPVAGVVECSGYAEQDYSDEGLVLNNAGLLVEGGPCASRTEHPFLKHQTPTTTNLYQLMAFTAANQHLSIKEDVVAVGLRASVLYIVAARGETVCLAAHMSSQFFLISVDCPFLIVVSGFRGEKATVLPMCVPRYPCPTSCTLAGI